jgi:hypothetical protein
MVAASNAQQELTKIKAKMRHVLTVMLAVPIHLWEWLLHCLVGSACLESNLKLAVANVSSAQPVSTHQLPALRIARSVPLATTPLLVPLPVFLARQGVPILVLVLATCRLACLV